ncbi:MAG TPA: MiaB/RimO family radical SAM methylthiotransferase, partial [Planctomycetaceae bacterium]|nr:MiaB/RimO family radical SAM methylthiotransferase [Planctomycetaceae bacterium]
AESRASRQRAVAVSLSRHEGTRVEVSESFQSYDPLREPEMRPSPFQAYVRIMLGCDKFCTYCVVPMTRGPEQSRSPSEIAAEVRLLADQGVKEVTLLGQTVNSYKYTQNGRLHRLSDLLALIHDTAGILRIKFVTNYPRDMTDDLLFAVRDLSKVCRYLHVPAQSGSDDVLRVMKRGYTVAQYLEMHDRIREVIPDCAVSSDFIVGHPGETETEFEKSIDLVRRCRFKNSFIFKYSPRPGTKAFERYPDDISEEIKRRRNNELLAIQNEISEQDNAAFIGREVEVLVEGLSKAARKQSAAETGTENGPIQLVGRSTCDRIVVFDGNPRLAGTLARISIDDCTATTLIGAIVTREIQHGSSPLLPILA